MQTSQVFLISSHTHSPFFFLQTKKQDVKTQSSISDEPRWVYFAARHPDASPVFKERIRKAELRAGSRGEGGREEGGGSRGAFDFSIKRIQMPSDLPFTALTGTPTYTSSHHHTPVHMQADGRSCGTPLCLTDIYI